MAVPIFLPSDTFGLPDVVLGDPAVPPGTDGRCPPGKVPLPGVACVVAPCPAFCVTGETFIQGGGPPPAEPAAAAGVAPQTVGAAVAAAVIAVWLWLNRDARRRA